MSKNLLFCNITTQILFLHFLLQQICYSQQNFWMNVPLTYNRNINSFNIPNGKNNQENNVLPSCNNNLPVDNSIPFDNNPKIFNNMASRNRPPLLSNLVMANKVNLPPFNNFLVANNLLNSNKLPASNDNLPICVNLPVSANLPASSNNLPAISNSNLPASNNLLVCGDLPVKSNLPASNNNLPVNYFNNQQLTAAQPISNNLFNNILPTSTFSQGQQLKNLDTVNSVNPWLNSVLINNNNIKTVELNSNLPVVMNNNLPDTNNLFSSDTAYPRFYSGLINGNNIKTVDLNAYRPVMNNNLPVTGNLINLENTNLESYNGLINNNNLKTLETNSNFNPFIQNSIQKDVRSVGNNDSPVVNRINQYVAQNSQAFLENSLKGSVNCDSNYNTNILFQNAVPSKDLTPNNLFLTNFVDNHLPVSNVLPVHTNNCQSKTILPVNGQGKTILPVTLEQLLDSGNLPSTTRTLFSLGDLGDISIFNGLPIASITETLAILS